MCRWILKLLPYFFYSLLFFFFFLFTARHHFTRHYKKLKREDFPDGGYLRIRHAHYLKHQRHSKKLSNNIPDDTHNGVLIYSQDSKRDHHNSRYFIDIDSSAESNDVFDDLEPADFIYKSHESLHRGRRDASKEIPIDYCCTQSGHDLCRRYSCH